MGVRRALAVVMALTAALLAAGCQPRGAERKDAAVATSASPGSTDASADAAPALPSGPSQLTASPRELPPAAAAGGACRAITFDAVARYTGIRFEVAGASGSAGRTQACVLQQLGAGPPDLAFSVT